MLLASQPIVCRFNLRKSLQFFAFSFVSVFSVSQANETVRPIGPDRVKIGTESRYVGVAKSRVAWADTAALRRDFVELRTLSDADINAWILENFAYISEGQLQLGTLRNSPIPIDASRRRLGFRPPYYRRAAVWNNVDLKGVGLTTTTADLQRTESLASLFAGDLNGNQAGATILNALRTRDHSDGLMSLGEAIAETTRQQAAQKLFDLRNAAHPELRELQTVETYFVIAFPFDILKEDGATIPAALYARQTHFARSHLTVPVDIYTDAFGHFQSSGRETAIDFGGVIITDPRLAKYYGVAGGGLATNPQDSTPWAWGHETALAFRRGDDTAVYRHVNEMLSPIENDWNALQVARRRQMFAAPASELSSLDLSKRLHRKMFDEVSAGLADKNPAVRLKTLALMTFYPGAEADDFFAQALSDSVLSIRIHAIEALELRGDVGPKTRNVFLNMLKNPDYEIRARATLALKSYLVGTNQSFIQASLNDGDSLVRAAAAKALAGCRGNTCFDLFEKALNDPSPKVRQSFIQVLGSYSGSRADVLVGQALSYRDDAIAAGAARSLDRYAGPNVEKLFAQALRHASPDVRSQALIALQRYWGNELAPLSQYLLALPAAQDIDAVLLPKILASRDVGLIEATAARLSAEPAPATGARAYFLKIVRPASTPGCGQALSELLAKAS